jgi:DNA polymerase-3 subunit gamma/tau
MRDAQSMLDQLVAFCGETIEEENVSEIFGFNSAESIAALAGMILRRDNAAALAGLHTHAEAGKDLSRLLGDLIGHFRNVLVVKVDPSAAGGELPKEVAASIQEQAAGVDTGRLLRLIDLFAETDARMKWAVNKKLHFEVGIIKAIQALGEANLDDVIALVSAAADSAGSSGMIPTSAPAARTPFPAAAPVREVVRPAPEPVANPAPVSRPAPIVAPVVSAPAAPEVKGDLSGEALWDAARDALIAAKPLLETWLSAASFVSHGDSAFTIGFSTEQRFFRESLSRYEKEIEQAVAARCATPVRLEIVVRADIAPAEMPMIEDEDEPSPAASVSVPAPAPQAVVEEPAAAAPSPEDFKNDPLIREALEAFEARIIKP